MKYFYLIQEGQKTNYFYQYNYISTIILLHVANTFEHAKSMLRPTGRFVACSRARLRAKS